MRSVRRLVVTCIAVLAVLMAALAPTLSHAFGMQGPTSWTEICTSAGAKLVPLDADGSAHAPLPGATQLLDHCPYCGLHADGFPVPPALPALPPPELLGALLPTAFLQADETLAVWSSAQPRAPPASI